MLSKWHPATKLLLGAAALVLPYLILTSSQNPTSAEEAAEIAQVTLPYANIGPLPLRSPPKSLESFSVTLERPLFSPTRRPLLVPPKVPPLEEFIDEAKLPNVDSAAATLQFVGTIGRNGSATALIMRSQERGIEALAKGDIVDGWTVVSISSRKLVMKNDDQTNIMTILQ